MSVPIVDKRHGYRPHCEFCHDEGCSACEPTIAQRIAERVAGAEQRTTAQEAIMLMKQHLPPLQPGSRFLMLPRTEDELLRLLVATIEYARLPLIKPTSTGAMGPEDVPERFDLLEWRDP